MRAWGFEPEDFAPPAVQVWPDNVPAVRVFLAMQTQWHVAMGGRTGLIYAALPEVWRRLKVPPGERDAIFHDLQFLEAAALAAMHPPAED